MPRKKKISPTRIAALVAVLLLIVLGGLLWADRARLRSALSLMRAEFAPQSQSSSTPDVKTPDVGAVPLQLKGKLDIIRSPRDAQLGVAADAIILFRKVEMFQWQERCDVSPCRYDRTWSDQHVDSSQFRTPAGHVNPSAPFANASFAAAEIRLDGLSVAPELVAAEHPAIDYPVRADMLPPNLAATFSVVDGVLYAGGDPAHPRPGMLRISYRVVPGGEISLSGVRRGSKLEAR